MARNPVMFVVEVGSVARDRSCSSGTSATPARRRTSSPALVAAWLWFTVLFANFAEAMAEGRGKAQADDAAQDPRRDDRAHGAAPTATHRGACRARSSQVGDLVVVVARAR